MVRGVDQTGDKKEKQKKNHAPRPLLSLKTEEKEHEQDLCQSLACTF